MPLVADWRMGKISDQEIGQSKTGGLAIDRIVADGPNVRGDVHERVREVAAEHDLVRAADPAEIVVAFKKREVNRFMCGEAVSQRKRSGDGQCQLVREVAVRIDADV